MNMKKLTTLAITMLLPLAYASASEIVAEFTDVDKYTDFSVNGLTEEKTLSIFKAELKPELERLAKKYIKEGQVLTLNFTDIDMAGDIQPWRNRYNADIRYVEDVYRPRLVFTYSLADADGNVIDEGEADVVDLAFMMNTLATFRAHHMSFFYELDLLSNWMRKTSRSQWSAKAED
jgi:hypothetical protein